MVAYAERINGFNEQFRSDCIGTEPPRSWLTGNLDDGADFSAIGLPFLCHFVEPFEAVAERQAQCLDIYGVTWKTSILSSDRKRMVCEYIAADTESVRKVQREAQAPFERIWAGTAIDPFDRIGQWPTREQAAEKGQFPSHNRDIEMADSCGDGLHGRTTRRTNARRYLSSSPIWSYR